MKTTKQTTEIDETPLTPHVPRRDIQRFNKNDIENYIYEHQHTKGLGPIQTCMVVQQYSDGYCTVITGPRRKRKSSHGDGMERLPDENQTNGRTGQVRGERLLED